MPRETDIQTKRETTPAPCTSHRLCWKGKITGPWTRAHIEELLRRGEISLLHGIEVDGEWRGLDDFLRPAPRSTQPHLANPWAARHPAAARQDEWDGGPTPPHAHPTLADSRRPAGPIPGDNALTAGGGDAFPALQDHSGVSPAAHLENGTLRLRLDLVKTGYFLCGLCFLLPFFATIPVIYIVLILRTRPAPASGHAQKILLSSIALTIAGSLFLLALRHWF
ncbi:MAG: hypothetical protein LBG65_07115 [Puniceicoccales bacterium]|jgi:hypothetical protein|nr:hypothetical protein [Puniceicoccales bacterium]